MQKKKYKNYNPKIKEECGVFGISDTSEASTLTALGLHALQHRGQEGCGIVSFDGKQYHSEKRYGLVGDNFNKEKVLNLSSIKSFDTKYFDFSFANNLSLEDGAATLTEFTVKIIISAIKAENRYKEKIILCGGGRKNSYLVEKLKRESNRIKLIDEYGVDGDFIESQAFAYLATRSYLGLPISFPKTTGVNKPCTGGVLLKV